VQNLAKEFEIVQLIYCSRAAHFKDSTLIKSDIQDILTLGQIYNFLHEITGALMTDGEMFAQVIEGPTFAVENLYSKIIKDKRHINIITLQRIPIHVRLFNYWPIAFIRVENMHYVRTLNAQSTPAELREASISILKDFRPVLLR